MAAVRGLCSSNLAASTSQRDSTPRLSSSSTRGNVHFISKPLRPHPSRKCRVLFAVLVDPKVKSTSTSKGITTIELEKSLEILSLTDFQTKLHDAATQAMSPPNSKDSSKVSAKKKPALGLTDTDLKSNLEHRLWVAFGGTAVTGMMAKAFSSCQSSDDILQVVAGIFAAYVLSDLGTGFYHWGVDNYGDATTPVFGSQIDAFQGHHQRPWTITKREFANNIHAIARPAGLFLTPFLLLPSQAFGDSFLAVFLGMVVMSQHFHALSHMKRSQLPSYIVALQDNGIILGRKMHGTHHRPPYDVNYCIGSGLWNPLLNRVAIFKKMERAIYAKTGVAPRAWSETSDEWSQADSYFEDGTEFDPSQSS